MTLLRRICTVVLAAFGLVASCPGFAATSVTLVAGPASIAYGDSIGLSVHVVTDVATCPALPWGPQGQVTLEYDGMAVLPSWGWKLVDASGGGGASCVNGVLTTDFFTLDWDLPFGAHVVSVIYTPPDAAGSTTKSNVVSVTVQPQSTGVTAAGIWAAGIMTPTPGVTLSWSCGMRSVQVQAWGPVDGPPDENVAGVVEYQAHQCGFPNCSTFCSALIPQQRVMIQLPRPIPPDAKFWVYRTGPGTYPGWQRIDAQVQGPYATLIVTGAPGNDLSGYIAMSVDWPVPDVQDMWWAGPAENGWGLSIAQEGSKLFVGLYVYREDGSPEWLVLPLGRWGSQGREYSGMLYEPKGSWFGQYDAAAFDPGNAVGQATITFSSSTAATLDYSIRGVSGHKTIERLPFGSTTTPPAQGERAGLWWAGLARTGWGLALGHQGNTLFGVWYTYAKDGSSAWYVMPGGTWTSSDTYSGTLYRTTGKSWLSGAYDPSVFKAAPVGTMTLHFTGPVTATMTFDVDGTTGSESISVQHF